MAKNNPILHPHHHTPHVIGLRFLPGELPCLAHQPIHQFLRTNSFCTRLPDSLGGPLVVEHLLFDVHGLRDSIGVHHEVVTFRELRLDGVVRRVFPYTEGVAVDLEFGDLALWSIAVSSCLN